MNTAARMEGLTKYFGAQIVISGPALEALGDGERVARRALGRVRVKGRVGDLPVYEIIESEPVESRALKERTRSDFEAALDHHAAGRPAQAVAAFERVLAVNPDDPAA